MKLSIRTKVILFTILPIIIVFAISSSLTIKKERENLIENVNKLMVHKAQSLSLMIEKELQKLETIAVLGAEFVEFSDNVRLDEALPYLERNFTKSDYLIGSRISLEPSLNDGKKFSASSAIVHNRIVSRDISQIIDYTNPKETWYSYPKKTLATYWDLPYRDREANSVVSRINAPIIKNEAFIGVSSVKFDLMKFNRLHLSSEYKSFYFTIIDKSGQIVQHPDSSISLAQKNLFINPDKSLNSDDQVQFFNQIKTGNSGKGVIRLSDGSDKIWAYFAPIKISNWYCCVFVSEEEALSETNNIIREELFKLLLITIFSLVIALFISNSITKPISEITSQINRLAEGNLEKIPELKSRDEINSLVRSFNIIIDKITERTDKVKEFSNRLKFALAASKDGVFDFTIKPTHIYFSHRIYEMLGYKNDEFLPTFKNWLKLIFSDDRRLAFNSLKNSLASKTGCNIEFRMIKKDGTVIWVHTKALIVDYNSQGNPSRIIGIHSDITNHKQFEEFLQSEHERYTTLISASNTGAWELNSNTNFLWCSKEYFSMLGREATDYDLSGNANLTETWHNLIHPDDREFANNTLKNYLNSGSQGYYENFYRMLHKDGKYVWIRARGKTLRDENNKLTAITVGTHIDITEIKNYESTILDMNKNLEDKISKRTKKLEETLLEVNKLNEKLILQEERSRNILLSVNDGIFGLDRDGLITFINPAVERLLGFSKEELIGKSEHTLFHHHYSDGRTYPPENCPCYHSIVEGIVSRIDDEVFWKKDGTYFPVEYSAVPIKKNDEIVGSVVSFKNVSRRKKLEAELKKTLILSENALELNNSGFLDAPLDGISFVNISERVLKIIGIEEKNSPYLTLNEFIKLLSNSETTDPDFLYREITKISKGENYKLDSIFKFTKPSDKSLIWLHFVGVRIIESNNSVHLYGVIRDISELRMTELKLENAIKTANQIIDSIPIPTAITRIKDGSVIRSNRAMIEFHGLPEEDLLKTTGIQWYANLEDRKLIIAELLSNHSIANVNLQLKSFKTNEIRDTIASFVKIILDDQECSLGAFIDITELKLLQDELKEAKETAEAATIAKSQFLATMSHEIRTPMNAIIGLTTLALKTELSKKQKDYLTKIEKSANSLLGIINDILDFSKIEAGKLDIETVEFDLEEVFESVSNLVAHKAQQKGLEFSLFIGKDVPLSLIGDPLRISQILVNFCGNAVKFTEKGDVVVAARVHEITNDKVKINFSVSDSGIGLTNAQKDIMFQSFSQADSSTTRKYGGTGLGLAISKRLAELMGGSVWFESKYQKGSTFGFIIELQMQKIQKRTELLSSKELKDMEVLICDDNQISRTILRENLESFGFKVEEADSGEKAIELIVKGSDKYKLVIIDWQMPELNGIETSEIIFKKRKISAPLIIMVSGFGKEDIAEKALEMGIKGFLTKPINSSSLFNTIMEVLGKEVNFNLFKEKALNENRVALARLKEKKILLVEDNEINQQVASELLSSYGFIVDIASDGKEALDKTLTSAKTSQYDLVLMDLQMPNMDGFESSEEIRKRLSKEELPIVAMTADAMFGIEKKCYDSGMQGYITKPIDPNKLIESLIKWIKPRTDLEADNFVKESLKNIGFDDIPIEGLDYENGLRRLGGNKSLYKNLLQKFYTSSQSIIENIITALNNSENDKAFLFVHTLKGTSGNLGAAKIYEVSSILENYLRIGDHEKIALTISQLNNEINSFREKFEKQSPPKEQVVSSNTDEILNSELFFSLISELKILLEENEFSSTHKLENILGLPGIGIYKKTLNNILKLVYDYKFEEALKELNTII